MIDGSLPGILEKFPDLSYYFNKSTYHFDKIQRGIFDTMPNLDLSICVLSVSARIDCLPIFSRKTDYLQRSPKSRK